MSSAVLSQKRAPVSGHQPGDGTIYGYTLKDIDGVDVPLSCYAGKVVLIVNVASQ